MPTYVVAIYLATGISCNNGEIMHSIVVIIYIIYWWLLGFIDACNCIPRVYHNISAPNYNESGYTAHHSFNAQDPLMSDS